MACRQNIWVAVAWRNIPRSSNRVVGGDNANGSLDTYRVPYILVGYCREYAKAMQDLSVGERFDFVPLQITMMNRD